MDDRLPARMPFDVESYARRSWRGAVLRLRAASRAPPLPASQRGRHDRLPGRLSHPARLLPGRAHFSMDEDEHLSGPRSLRAQVAAAAVLPDPFKPYRGHRDGGNGPGIDYIIFVLKLSDVSPLAVAADKVAAHESGHAFILAINRMQERRPADHDGGQ